MLLVYEPVAMPCNELPAISKCMYALLSIGDVVQAHCIPCTELTEALPSMHFSSPAPVNCVYNVVEAGVRLKTKIDRWPHLSPVIQSLIGL